MYLYNTTIIAEMDRAEAIRAYLTEQLAAMESDVDISLLEMVDSPHEGITYCVQLRTKTTAEIHTFRETHLATIQTKLEALHSGKVLFFDSTMKFINR